VLCINYHCDILKIGDDSYHHKNGADPSSDPGQYCTLTPGQIWALIDIVGFALEPGRAKGRFFQLVGQE
jgi:hypothetical protein